MNLFKVSRLSLVLTPLHFFMNWKKLLLALKQKTNRPISNKLDHKLLKKVRTKLFPGWSQLKYINNFLTQTEKTAIKISIFIFFLASLAWVTISLIKNKVSVPTIGGEYSEALIGQPKFINPLYANTSDIDADLTYLIYSGLFQYNEQQKLLPDLASKYTVSEDKKIYDIQLRQDVKWSDNEQFTADDVLFTFKTIQNPMVNSPLLASFQGVTVEKTGEYSIRFTLKEVFAPFLSSLITGILPEHVWKDIQPINIKLAKTNLQPIGTGPWQFNKLIKDQAGNIQSYILSPNKNYHKQIPYLKTLTFKFYPDYNQALNALKSQEITALSFVPSNLQDKISNKNFNFHNFYLPQYSSLFFNQTKDIELKDKELRLALAQATDRLVIVKALNNAAEIVNSPILPNTIGYDPNLKYPEFNASSSNKLLDKKWPIIQPEQYFKIQTDKLLKNRQAELDKIKQEASSTPEIASSSIAKIIKEIAETVRQKMDAKQSFYRTDKNDNILELTITTANTAEYKTVAETITNLWQTVGIKTNLQLIDISQMKDVLKKRDYNILLYGQIMDNDPDPYPFWHSSQIKDPGFNFSLFTDREVDDMLVEARSATSTQQREKLYKQFQQILSKELPALFLYTPTHTMIISKTIKGVYIQQIFSPNERYAGLNNWYTKTKKKWRLSSK